MTDSFKLIKKILSHNVLFFWSVRERAMLVFLASYRLKIFNILVWIYQQMSVYTFFFWKSEELDLNLLTTNL